MRAAPAKRRRGRQARAEAAAREAEALEAKDEEMEMAQREYTAARRYSGSRVGRSSAKPARRGDTFGEAMTKMVVKELSGTTGRRILGGIFKAR